MPGGLLDRRSFLALTALGVAGGLRGGAVTQRRLGLKAIGIQLYSVRRELARDFEGTLVAIASIGYREVEFAGYLDNRPEDIKALLKLFGLAAPSAHIPIEVARRDWPTTLAAANVIGHQYVVIPWLPPEERRTIDDYHRRAAELNRLGQAANRAGLRLAYHNHDFEFAPIRGRIPYDVLVAETDPADVTLELDLMWITKGCQNPSITYMALTARAAAYAVEQLKKNQL